ncbi:MAG: 50S ribosomal protein L18 [Saprospiraceae bacterium]|nr:50S ribosomal protein L18 [Saprospiraceae bacterium]MCB0622876.1 50S ribosomal protein L18 [Saprospiraceae bacterium]MCB0677055.1 50S ribosomal protein L18 [Saprospiraceae bacterium]MCB0679788.1 50S ribosomal protein L18 [Saprospiraceae bacterium]
MKFKKENRRQRIHYRIRKKVQGTAERPRLSVYRSNKSIYCQVIDDVAGRTLVAASTFDEGINRSVPKADQARQVGKVLAEKALAQKISVVVFDRGGYLYHGRVKALADGAREGGLKL